MTALIIPPGMRWQVVQLTPTWHHESVTMDASQPGAWKHQGAHGETHSEDGLLRASGLQPELVNIPKMPA